MSYHLTSLIMISVAVVIKDTFPGQYLIALEPTEKFIYVRKILFPGSHISEICSDMR